MQDLATGISIYGGYYCKGIEVVGLSHLCFFEYFKCLCHFCPLVALVLCGRRAAPSDQLSGNDCHTGCRVDKQPGPVVLAALHEKVKNDCSAARQESRCGYDFRTRWRALRNVGS